MVIKNKNLKRTARFIVIKIFFNRCKNNLFLKEKHKKFFETTKKAFEAEKMKL
jgi:hypothetical protein